MLAARAKAHLAIIDIQNRLAPAVHNVEPLIRNAERLIRYADRFEIPITFTEQMPERIGATLGHLRDVAGDRAACLAKTTFSAVRSAPVQERFQAVRETGRNQIVVAGMEAHVCVLQTVLEWLETDYDVFVVADAVSSRTPENRALAIDRMAKAGAVVVSHEMVAFEWLERADTPEFKDLLPLFK